MSMIFYIISIVNKYDIDWERELKKACYNCDLDIKKLISRARGIHYGFDYKLEDRINIFIKILKNIEKY